MHFSTILIANRGEIACRIARTARRLGYRAVAVYSDADACALHVAQADAAVRIGSPPATESYLSIPALIGAARAVGADAIHPGYGFLSENAAFAAACAEAGLVFIGPPVEAIRAMGNKAEAKRLMRDAGVPVVPGYDGDDQSQARLEREAAQIGFPVMVKAAAGGGGRGMRLAAQAGELAAALATARSEAENAFGSGELILEKALTAARHVEIQVFADRHGNVIHLGERDCSTQRRHQKIIEEAPSPAVSTELRAQMGQAAVAAARSVGYVGAGTVEFLLDANGQFYFLEMNTRLQVEHPVTEMITGLDLVAWQIRVAAGEPLPLDQHEIAFHGHAIEARLYAEDAGAGFLPQTGRVLAWMPAAGEGIRIDHGIRAGQEIGAWYDPMLAKIIAHGTNREEARRRLVRALHETLLLGVTANRDFLIEILQSPAFAAGTATTAFVAEHVAARPAAGPPPRLLMLAAALWFENAAGNVAPLWRNWHSSGPAPAPMLLATGDARHPVEVTALGPGRYRIGLGGESADLEILEMDAGRLRTRLDGIQGAGRYLFDGDMLYLDVEGQTLGVGETLFEPSAVTGAGETELRAPMSGRIVAVLAEAGQKVARGQRLVVLEAMKMQHEMLARVDGVIERMAVAPGDQVSTRQLLVALKPAGSEEKEHP